jgi:hypothetical protein
MIACLPLGNDGHAADMIGALLYRRKIMRKGVIAARRRPAC